jgi:hypothetical protein
MRILPVMSSLGVDPEFLGKKILAVDPAILRVFVLDQQGGELAHVYSETYPEKERVDAEAETKFARLDSISLGMFQQQEKFYGAMDFILLAYKEAKLMLMYSEKHGVHLAARIICSANAEYLHTKVRAILA